MPPSWAMLTNLDSLTPDILAKYFGVQLGGLSYQWRVGHNNYVCVSHLWAILHHSMPWPLSGFFLHHCLHGPRVAFAAASKQIKGLVYLYVAVM